MNNCRRLQMSWALLLCGLLGSPASGQAQGAGSEEAAPGSPGSHNSPEVAVPPGAAFFGAPKADLAVLDSQRGGADTTVYTVMNDIRTSGNVTGNEAYNLSTGMNSIADGAFVGAQGFSTVVQNSGNNVLIQNSTIINIQLK